jgi:prevent-host-death family protein
LISVTIFEAKTTLSELIRQAQTGEEVVITSGRDKTPVARLLAVEPVGQVRLGVLETPGFVLPAAFFEPLPEDELKLWNEGTE